MSSFPDSANSTTLCSRPFGRHRRHRRNDHTLRGPAASSHRCSPSPARYYTGLRSLHLPVPPGLTGGAYVDAPVKQGWLYVVKAKIFHENEATLALAAAAAVPGTEAAGAGVNVGSGVSTAGRKSSTASVMTSWTAGRKELANTAAAITTRLVLWDMRDGKEMSAPAVKTGEWEVSRGTLFLRGGKLENARWRERQRQILLCRCCGICVVYDGLPVFEVVIFSRKVGSRR